MHLRRFAANTNSPNARNHTCNVLPLSGFTQAYIVSILRPRSFIRIAYADRNLAEPSRKQILQIVDLISAESRKINQSENDRIKLLRDSKFLLYRNCIKITSANINIINNTQNIINGEALPMETANSMTNALTRISSVKIQIHMTIIVISSH